MAFSSSISGAQHRQAPPVCSENCDRLPTTAIARTSPLPPTPIPRCVFIATGQGSPARLGQGCRPAHRDLLRHTERVGARCHFRGGRPQSRPACPNCSPHGKAKTTLASMNDATDKMRPKLAGVWIASRRRECGVSCRFAFRLENCHLPEGGRSKRGLEATTSHPRGTRP
jgi:hypothetical protein